MIIIGQAPEGGRVDPGVIVGTVGALAGVGLGSWLSGRAQREALRESERQAEIERREAAYVEFIAAYRVFRRFVVLGSTKITLAQMDRRAPYPLIEGSEAYWGRVEAARARLDLVAGDTPVWAAGSELAEVFYDVARARAERTPGVLPAAVIEAASRAEREFARVAREDLRTRRSPGSSM